MEKVNDYDLLDGSTLELYTNGVVITKVNGKIEGRVNPTESFLDVTASGGYAKARSQVDKEVNELLDAIVDGEPSAVDRRLAKASVTGKGDQGIKSLVELLKRHGQHSEVEQAVEVLDANRIKYKGRLFHNNDHILTPKFMAEMQPKIVAIFDDDQE